MPKYLLSGRNQWGLKVARHVHASDVTAAVKQLEDRGVTEVVLHTDDIHNLVGQQTLAANGKSENDTARMFSPREIVALQRDGSVLGQMKFVGGRLFRSHLIAICVFVGIVTTRYTRGMPIQAVDYLIIIAMVLLNILMLMLVFFGPPAQYQRLIEASSWGRWEQVLKLVPQLEGKISPHELACRKADALSALGKLDEALEVMKPFENDPQSPLWMYYARLSSVYSWSHDFESSVGCCQKAAELAPDQPTVLLDYAVALIRRKHDPRASRQLLEEAKRFPIPDAIGFVVDQCQGLIDLEEHRDSEALANLLKAMEKLKRYLKANALMGFFKDRLHAYLCIAYAQLGDDAEARRHYKLAEPRMKALRQDDLIERCEKLLRIKSV